MTWCDVVCQDTGSTKRGAAASSIGPEEETLGLGLETGQSRMVCQNVLLDFLHLL